MNETGIIMLRLCYLPMNVSLKDSLQSTFLGVVNECIAKKAQLISHLTSPTGQAHEIWLDKKELTLAVQQKVTTLF